MTMDRTLKQRGGLARMRSVLTRDERIQQMIEEGKFDPQKDNPFGLPKLRIRHSKAGTKTKTAAEPAPAEVAEGAEAEKAPAAEGPRGAKKES